MKRSVRRTIPILVILALVLACLMPAAVSAKTKTCKISVVSGIGNRGEVTYNKKGFVTEVTGEFYTLKYSYTKSGKVKSVTETELGEPVSKTSFKYSKGKICKLSYKDYAANKTKTYTVKSDKYGRIVSIGSKCTFTYSKGCLKKATAYYSCEQETVTYTYTMDGKNYLKKLSEASSVNDEILSHTYKKKSKGGNVVQIRKIGKEPNTLNLRYQKIEIPKKYLKTVKQQRRDLQYYQIERLTMNPIMYPAAWVSDTEVLTYYN